MYWTRACAKTCPGHTLPGPCETDRWRPGGRVNKGRAPMCSGNGPNNCVRRVIYEPFGDISYFLSGSLIRRFFSPALRSTCYNLNNLKNSPPSAGKGFITYSRKKSVSARVPAIVIKSDGRIRGTSPPTVSNVTRWNVFITNFAFTRKVRVRANTLFTAPLNRYGPVAKEVGGRTLETKTYDTRFQSSEIVFSTLSEKKVAINF